jgi:peroxiredoxin
MIHTLGLIVAMCASTSARLFQPSDDQSPAERYAALLKAYDAPRNETLRNPAQTKTAATAFLDLAQKHPEDPAALDALNWVVGHSLFTSEADAAMDLLARDHSDKPALSSIVCELNRLYGEAFPPLERMLRQLQVKSSNVAVRGNACLSLAHKLRQKRTKAENDAFQNALFMKGGSVPYVEKPKFSEKELLQILEDRIELLHRVAKEYGQIEVNGQRLAELAETERRSVGVGDATPDINSSDTDERPFKLSDYRGKVVVLVFSTSSCPPCVASYPEHRRLIKTFEGQPFALLSVNADSKDVVLQSIEAGKITWRCWCDGPADGPICTQWNVVGFPTIFVIDARGVVRFVNVQSRTLESAVEFLLSERAK